MLNVTYYLWFHIKYIDSADSNQTNDLTLNELVDYTVRAFIVLWVDIVVLFIYYTSNKSVVSILLNIRLRQ